MDKSHWSIKAYMAWKSARCAKLSPASFFFRDPKDPVDERRHSLCLFHSLHFRRFLEIHTAAVAPVYNPIWRSKEAKRGSVRRSSYTGSTFIVTMLRLRSVTAFCSHSKAFSRSPRPM